MGRKILNVFSNNYIIFCVYAFIGWIYEVSWYLLEDHIFVNRGVLWGPFLPIYGFGILILLLFLKEFMKKRHEISNIFWTSMALFTISTFVYTTIIEYSVPKIYSVVYYLENYGLGLILANLITIIGVNILIQKSKDEKIKKIDVTVILVFLFIWIITTLIEYVSHYFIEVYAHKMLWDYSNDFLNINRRVNWVASRNFAIGGTLLLYIIQPLINKFLIKTKLNIKVIISLIIGIPMLIDFIMNVIMK